MLARWFWLLTHRPAGDDVTQCIIDARSILAIIIKDARLKAEGLMVLAFLKVAGGGSNGLVK